MYQTYNWGMGGEGTSSGSPCGYTEGTGQIATGPAWPYEWDEVGACGMCSLEQLQKIIPEPSVRWPINGSDPKSAPWHWHAAFSVQRNDTWLSPSSYRWLFMPPRGPRGTWAEPLPTLQADRGRMAVPATDHALGDMFESTRSIPSSKARSPLCRLDMADEGGCPGWIG